MNGPYPNHLARFMRAKGITDPDLARMLDISKQQIFNLRHGNRKLTVEWARRLAPHLGVPWQELITGSPSLAANPAREELLAHYDVMSAHDRETLLRVAQSLSRDDPPTIPVRPKGADPPHPRQRGMGQKIKVGGRAR